MFARTTLLPASLALGAATALSAAPPASAPASAPPPPPAALPETRSPVGLPPPEAPGAPLALGSLNRMLRWFDFEEAEAAPHEMPIHFYRVPAREQGFPPFGRMRLSRETPHRGRWCFELELEGGSLAARVPGGVLPVLPGSDFVVEAWIRTEGLHHARARIVAEFFDATGNPIAGSRSAGPLLETAGAWTRTAIEMAGSDDSATDLVLEVQVLQPAQYLRPGEQEGEPRLQDLAGRVWFDDLIIWQRPRIELSTASPGNVIEPGEPVSLSLMVRDVLPGQLTAELRVEDFTGATVHAERFVLPQGTWRHELDLGSHDSGWYRAVLDVSDRREVVGTRAVNIVILPQPRRGAAAASRTRFGVVLPPSAMTGDARTTAQLIRRLGARSAVLPASDTVSGNTELRHLARELPGRNIELTLALTEPPAGASGVLVELLARDPKPYRELLSGVALSVGLEVPRWLIGTPGALDSVPAQRLGEVLLAARRTIEQSIPAPILLVPFRAEDEAVELPPGFGHWFTVSWELRPESLEQYAANWPLGRSRVDVALELAPAGQYPPRQRVADLVLRMLHGWRAELPHVAFEAPWTRRPHSPATVMPEPAYAVWRTVADELAGRSFGGELTVGDGLRCWILAGPSGDGSALVAWNEHAGAEDAALRMLLADGPVEIVDVFGNRRTVTRGAEGHEIPLGDLPVFIEGTDDRLARFRSSLTFRPDYVPARHQMHDCVAVLQNPWNIAISGTIRYEPPPEWSISPRTQRFSIQPGGQVELPISLRLGRGAITGPALVEADIDFAADGEYRIRAQAALEIGIDSIEFAAHWRAEGRDLIVTQIVTNVGEKPLELQGYVSAPDIAQQRRPFAVIAPGRSAVRNFTLVDGVRLLAGRRIHVGVSEKDGTARLNHVLDIPAKLN